MSSVTITIPSERIYLDTLSITDQRELDASMRAYNRAKEHLYNIKYDNTFTDSGIGKKNETAHIKEWIRKELRVFPQDYYITSLMSHADGMIRSQKELLKQREDEMKAASDARKKKLKGLRRKLTLLKKSKDSMIRYSKAGNKVSLLHIPVDFEKHMTDRNDPEAVYLYEVWLDEEIKRVHVCIAQIGEKERRHAEKMKDLTPARVAFGTKAHYKTKDTIEGIDMDQWHEERDFARNHVMLFSGRFDARYKNWLCKYDIFTGIMDITLMNGHVLSLKNVSFPYRGKDLETVLLHKKERGYSVGYWLELRKDHLGRTFLLIKATFRLYADDAVDTGNGVIAVDLNLDNLSWAELDHEGHRLRGGMVCFSLDGTSNRNKDTLGRACRKITKLCADTGKPLVMEDISLVTKKASLAYGGKKANRGTSMFAYSVLDTLFTSQMFRYGMGIIKVNPAYTSFIGKVKYMQHLRCEVHEAAAYVIGRRGMGYRERVPEYLNVLLPDNKKRAHHWKQFAHLFTELKTIKTRDFLTKIPAELKAAL